MAYRAVIFDLGGVVLPSPMPAFRSYERRLGLREGFLSEIAVSAADGTLWPRYETSELSPDEFGAQFEAACAGAGCAVVVTDLMEEIYAMVSEPRAEMIA